MNRREILTAFVAAWIPFVRRRTQAEETRQRLIEAIGKQAAHIHAKTGFRPNKLVIGPEWYKLFAEEGVLSISDAAPYVVATHISEL